MVVFGSGQPKATMKKGRAVSADPSRVLKTINITMRKSGGYANPPVCLLSLPRHQW